MLKEIEESVQQVAEAIAIAIGVEVEIVDDELTIIGGTGAYKEKRGLKEEAGRLDGNYIYARVLRTRKTEFVENVSERDDYGVNLESGRGYELAEVCTPIQFGDNILGIIGLVAASEKQRSILLEKEGSLAIFVEKMADLLAIKAEQQRTLIETEMSRNEMNAILEAAHEGIFAVDYCGYVTQCNSLAGILFKTTKMDLIGKHLNAVMSGTSALEVLETGVGYTECEEMYTNRYGDFHFIVTAKPFRIREQIAGVVISFRDIQEAQKLVYNFTNRMVKNTFGDIIGESEVVKTTKSQAMRTAKSSSTVLVTGESGTGKEMYAKAIHYAGSRAKGPFVVVNCGAIPENLLESELFGYEKGAFTGANEKGKIGKFEQASGGTIFLDEIGDMPLHLQVKMLHVLQNMRFERVGGNRTIHVDVRVIAATNKDLEEMISCGSFREDLYYRLSVIPLSIPPLRRRKEDIRLLIHHFLVKYNTFMGKNIEGLSEEAEKNYLEYDWPGNVRELENAVEYGVNMAYGDRIDIDAVPQRILRRKDVHVEEEVCSELPLGEQIKRFEREIVRKRLERYGDTPSAKEKAARDLGLSRATLYRKLAELDLN